MDFKISSNESFKNLLTEPLKDYITSTIEETKMV